MPRLSHAQDATRQHLAGLIAAGLTPDQFGCRLLEALETALPSDGARLLGIDPATLLVNRTIAASENDAWARGAWLREAYLASGPLTYIDFPTIMQAGPTAVAFHERQSECWGYTADLLAPVPERLHLHAFHENQAPVGGTLLASIPSGTADRHWIAALQIYRRDPKRPFTRGDVAFLRLLVPAIGTGLRAAFARERAACDVALTMPDASGVIVLEPDGRVRFSTPAGEAWAKRLRDTDQARHDPLPTAIWSAVARLRAEADSPSAGTLVASTDGGAVRIEASPGGADGSVAVILAPERPLAPPEPPTDWPLTAAERQVITLLLRGFSNRQIAGHLTISENTVQTHLRHIYDKLSVTSRSQLMARYFHEVSGVRNCVDSSDVVTRGGGVVGWGTERVS